MTNKSYKASLVSPCRSCLSSNNCVFSFKFCSSVIPANTYKKKKIRMHAKNVSMCQSLSCVMMNTRTMQHNLQRFVSSKKNIRKTNLCGCKRTRIKSEISWFYGFYLIGIHVYHFYIEGYIEHFVRQMTNFLLFRTVIRNIEGQLQ